MKLKVQCSGITKSGERCRIWCRPDTKYCYIHKISKDPPIQQFINRLHDMYQRSWAISLMMIIAAITSITGVSVVSLYNYFLPRGTDRSTEVRLQTQIKDEEPKAVYNKEEISSLTPTPIIIPKRTSKARSVVSSQKHFDKEYEKLIRVLHSAPPESNTGANSIN
jgi:hypothetical protein